MVWLDPTSSYKFNLTDANGNQIPGYPIDNVSGPINLSSNLVPSTTNTYTLGTPVISWANLYLGPNAIPVFDNVSGNDRLYSKYSSRNRRRYYTDRLFLSVSGHASLWHRSGGGDRQYIDRSGRLQYGQDNWRDYAVPAGGLCFLPRYLGRHARPSIYRRSGATFRPATSSPTNNCIVYANNSAASWSDTYVRFRNCVFNAAFTALRPLRSLTTACTTTGPRARFFNCQFSFGKIAGFYGYFAQYTEFWECLFNVCASTTSSAGCLLESAGLSASTNEVIFARCEFFSNSIGAWLKGAQKTSFYRCTFQGHSGGTGVILLDADSTSSETGGTDIRSCWFEANSNPHIYESVAYGTLIDGNQFWATGGVNTITFTHCSALAFVGNTWSGGGSPAVNINHPSGNTDCTQLLWRGNAAGTSGDMVPTLNISHSGTYALDLHWSASFTGTLTGCTTAPTQTIQYTVEGSCVDLKLPWTSSLTATSNSTSCTITGLPSALAPLLTQAGTMPFLEDNGALFIGQAAIAAGTTIIQLYKGGASAGFTNSGTKGINGGALMRYPLYT